MKTITTRRTVAAVLLALSAALAAAQTAQPANGRMRIITPYTESGFRTFDGRSLSAQDVQTAIRRAATMRRWKLAPAGPGHMTATYKDDDEIAVVDIEYDARHFTINYRDSSNLYFRTVSALPYVDPKGNIAPPGTKLIHKEYVEWVDDLRNTIRLALEN